MLRVVHVLYISAGWAGCSGEALEHVAISLSLESPYVYKRERARLRHIAGVFTICLVGPVPPDRVMPDFPLLSRVKFFYSSQSAEFRPLFYVTKPYSALC